MGNVAQKLPLEKEDKGYMNSIFLIIFSEKTYIKIILRFVLRKYYSHTI